MLKKKFTIIFAIQNPDKSVLKEIHRITKQVIILPQTNDYEYEAVHLKTKISHKDIVVVDGYHFKTSYQKIIKEADCKLVCIDDLNAWHQVADVIINHAEGISPSSYSADSNSNFCLGLKYALLRKPFYNKTLLKEK